eukprot:3263099-Amphidinium_carterae.1
MLTCTVHVGAERSTHNAGESTDTDGGQSSTKRKAKVSQPGHPGATFMIRVLCPNHVNHRLRL